MVLLALSMIVIVLAVGFAVDLGSWYLQASKLQRASDSAALSAATELPNVDTATDAANAAYRRNGLVDGKNNIVITNAMTPDGHFTTSVRNSQVPTYFVSLILPTITIKRASIAEEASAIDARLIDMLGRIRLTK